jgi:membrane protease YdiL (CAAX protease family)
MAAITTTHPAPTSSLKRFIIRHPVAAFLGLVYGISWLLFLPSFLSQNGIGVLPFAIPVTPFLLLSVIFGLTLPAYIVTRVTGGREGVRDLRRRYTHWRIGIGWYLLALFALPIADLLGASLWLGTAPLAAFANRWQLLFTVLLPEALVGAVLINLWEEGAWTGFLLPRLQERWGALTSSVLVAAAMGLFHVPLIFILGGVSDAPIPPNQYWLYFVLLFVGTVPFRVLVTWLWNRTRGSVIVVALVHAAFNVTTGQKFLPEFVPGDRLWVYGVYTVLALIVITLTRGRLAYTADDALGRE